MRIQIENITPDLALFLLEHNKSNRKLRKNHVAFLSEQIQQGGWQISPQGIALEGSIKDPESVLDGQHRLHAVVDSNKAVQMVVAEFCDPAVYGVIDTGIVRNLHDLTGIDRKVIDVASYLIQISSGHNMRSSSLKVREVVAILEPVISAMGEAFTFSTKIVMQAPIRAAFACRVLEDPSRAEEIVRIMRHLSDFDTAGIPAIWAGWLKRMHTGNITSNTGQKKHSKNRSVLFALTWDALDLSKSNNSRIQINSELVHIEAARKILRKNGI